MARRCELTGVGAQSGNNVSHSHRKTRRKFEVNLQNVSLYSEALKQYIPLRITAATLRSVDHNGGLDAFLVTTANSKLTEIAQKLKKKIKKASALENEAPKKATKASAKSKSAA